MRRASLVSVLFLLTVPLWGQEVADANAPGPRIVDENGHVIQLYLEKDHPAHQASLRARTQNLINHGGPIIVNPDVVSIFWGALWGTDPTHVQVMNDVLSFFANFGSTGEWNTIKQYGVTSPASLTNQEYLDTSELPNPGVTDAQIQGEVSKYIDGGGKFDNHTVYEVFLPSNHYAVIGSATSCGGPHLQFCAYHSNYTHNGLDIKYSSMPYPSCSGCQTSGWGDALNFNHFATHETREAATDPDGTAWYDRSGNEADDKCAWNPTPFIDSGFGYQYEWSNADGRCVKTK
jgi:hypothetical protein